MTILSGVTMGQVGSEYDFAMGFDANGAGTAKMYGYCLTEKGVWEESTQLQDTQRLLQVSSSSTTDRDLSRWPKVSQGDWSTGEGQVIFVDPTRYYSTAGQVNVTTPATLTTFPSGVVASSITAAQTGGFNKFPLASDGDRWFYGRPDGTLIVGHEDGTVTSSVGPWGAVEIGAIEFANANGTAGVFIGTNNGIWFRAYDGTFTQWQAGGIEYRSEPALAYINGRLYFTVNSTVNPTIWYVTAPGATNGTLGYTASQMEGQIRAITYTPNGLLWATTTEDNTVTLPIGRSYLFESAADLTGVNRVGEIPGRVHAMGTIMGVTYILAHLPETPRTNFNLTLFSWNGSTLTVLDDMRYALPDFQAVVAPVVNGTYSVAPQYMNGQVYGDGRFVYVAWPGLQVLQLDIGSPTKGVGISRVAGNGGNNTVVHSHRIVRTQFHGLVDLLVNTLGGTVTTYNGTTPPQGILTTSYFDFNTPNLVKVFRSLDIDLAQPLGASDSIAVSYQVDSDTAWTGLSLSATSTTHLVAYFPNGIKATRVRYQITMNGSPIIRDYSSKATLGRVWKTTVSCRRRQQTNLNVDDSQGALAQDLLGNIKNAYANAGRCILFVPNPALAGVEQVNASLEDYKWTVSKPGPRQNELMSEDIEGEVELTLAEII